MTKISWADAKKNSYPKLDKNYDTEILIIGGGLAGVWCAYLLAKAGRQVVLLEADEIGAGATYLTTAIITQVIDTDAQDLLAIFGVRRASQSWEAGRQAIDLIEQAIKQEKIECEFSRCPLFAYANSEKEFQYLQKEATAIRRLGFAAEINRQDSHLGFKNSGYYRLGGQAKYHPLKFLYGLAQGAVRHGALIFEKSSVRSLQTEGKLVLAKVGSATVTAECAVIATYKPFDRQFSTFLKKGMYSTFMIEANLPKGRVPEGVYEDSGLPYHYFRVDSRPNFDRLIGGGEDHRSEIKISPAKSFAALIKYFKNIFGADLEVVSRWGGPILEPIDGLPLIGAVAKNVYVATAFSGNGMTYAPISGRLISDLILAQPNPYQKLYDPKRLPTMHQLLIKGRDYTEEFFQGTLKTVLRR